MASIYFFMNLQLSRQPAFQREVSKTFMHELRAKFDLLVYAAYEFKIIAFYVLIEINFVFDDSFIQFYQLMFFLSFFTSKLRFGFCIILLFSSDSPKASLIFKIFIVVF